MLTIQLITLILFAILRTASSFPKRGLAYNNVEMLHNWNGQGSQIQWAYNWGSAMDANFPSCLEYVPMLWDDKPTSTANWVNNVNAALGRGSGHLLSFNEPDECGSGQACMMDTVAAAAAYKQYMMPFEGRASLGAPAITNGDSEMTWLKDFFANCQGCKFDFVPIHWYGDASDVTTFQNYLWNAAQLAATVKAELWVTEYNINSGDPGTFLTKMIPFLDNGVARHAFFWADPTGYKGNKIVDENGNPTPLGNQYAYTQVGG